MAWTMIENGTLTDADEVMDNYAFILHNMLAAPLDGLTVTSQDQLNYLTFTARTQATEADDCHFDEVDSVWTLGPKVQAPVDFSTGWENFANTTTTSGSQRIADTDDAGGEGTFSTNFAGTTQMIVLDIDRYRTNTGSVYTYQIYVTDGSTNVVISNGSEFPLGSSQSLVDRFRSKHYLYFDASAETITIDGGSPVDVSSLNGTTMKLRFYTDYSSGTTGYRGIWQVWNIYSYTSTSLSGSFETIEDTASATVTGIIGRITSTANGATITTSASANSGSNYDTLTDKEIAKITNTGTGTMLKVAMSTTLSDLSSFDIDDLPQVSAFAYYYL